MSWKARLVWDDETVDVNGEFDTEDEAYEAANETISTYHQGNAVLSLSGEDVDDSDPEIEVWDDEE